ncbi:MAG: hypothetical protein QOJ57_1085, partial [Thermoleophilaceae bacterium]|nr:hypothetical protein [Thermoleophilaceae bacterium]
TYADFAQGEIAALDELRRQAVERRAAALVELGREEDAVPELRALLAGDPLREGAVRTLMTALYRAGRQVEALDVYREARRELSDSFGLEPGPGLRELERAILRHDPALAPSPVSAPWQSEPEGTLLVAARDPHELRAMSRIAAELARRPPRELLVTLLVPDESALGAATAELARQRETLGEGVRTAAFVAPDLAEDVRRLVRAHDLDLVLVGVPPGFGDDPGPPPPELAAVLEQSACDVAIVSGTPTPSGGDGGVVVPFGGGEHDWAAAELGAWLAAATGMRLRLAGARAGPGSGGRDASRLLADASLAVQRTVGIAAEPFLVDPGTDGLLEAAAEGSAVVIGLSSRWRREGLGDARRAVVAGARCPVLVVHRGPRPSGIAPRASATRFTWSLGSDRS